MRLPTSPEEPLYPIGDAAERSGLEPSLLRMWERRYGLVTPARLGLKERASIRT